MDLDPTTQYVMSSVDLLMDPVLFQILYATYVHARLDSNQEACFNLVRFCVTWDIRGMGLCGNAKNVKQGVAIEEIIRHELGA